VVTVFAAYSLMGRVIVPSSSPPFLPIAMMALFVLPRSAADRVETGRGAFCPGFAISWSYETASIATGFRLGTITILTFWARSLGLSHS